VTGRDLLADGFLVAAFFPLLQAAFSLLPGTLGVRPGLGGGSSTPARRAFESPIAIGPVRISCLLPRGGCFRSWDGGFWAALWPCPHKNMR
jgi:hypothetical protein